MNVQNRKKLYDLMNAAKQGKMNIDIDRYSMFYEPLIQQAVGEKRNGNYDNAIQIYLKIFETEEELNSGIMSFLFKVLVCDGELVAALELIRLAEDALISQEGPMAPLRFYPGGPVIRYTKWKQTEYRDNLYLACRGAGFFNGDEFSVPTFGEPVGLLELARSMSGNPDFTFKCDEEKLAEEMGMVVIMENLKRKNS